ncbi:MAG: glycosyltransferase [Ginsengibacter sp.]
MTQVSVIIPARNESKNITACIESILKQTYSSSLFEVIVVDDHSTDDTAELVASYKNRNVRLIKLSDELKGKIINSYKKKAIEEGIKKASGTLIVTTDADCIVKPNWLLGIVSFYEVHNAAFIAAPVSFYEEKNDLLKIFQSIDFLTMQGITGAAVNEKFQCMCNGANLAYEKKVFEEVGGFTGIDKIASGDDMLLMHKIFSRYPERVLFLKNKDVIVSTKPMDSIGDFLNQRIRWASKADKFQDKKITLVLALVYFLNVFLFGGTVGAFLNHTYYENVLLAWVVKTLVELFFILPVANFFYKTHLLWWYPVLQPFHVIYIIISGWLGKFGKYKWKERSVR